MSDETKQQQAVAEALFQLANESSYKHDKWPRWEWLTEKIQKNWMRKADVAIAAYEAALQSQVGGATSLYPRPNIYYYWRCA